jgi:tetratricopeptide (TPR) repeat protein
MKLSSVYSLYLVLVVTVCVFFASPQASALSNFEKGLSAYNAKNYAEAQAAFSAALEESPNNIGILSNLALTHFELNQKGKALAYWLKALKLDPGFEEAQKGAEFVRSKLAPNAFSVKDTDFESLRKSLLTGLSLNLLFGLTALTFLVAGLQWIKHLSQAKKAAHEEAPLPPISLLSIGFSLLFVVCAVVLTLKTWDHLTPRAIVVKEKVELKIAPGADQSKIVELNEGTEVEIGIVKDAWVQVKIPGNYSGWLNKEEIQIIL